MTNTTPDPIGVHAHDKPLPKGKVMLAATPPQNAPSAERRLLESTTRDAGSATLHAVTAGWAPAGSMARWDNGHYRVTLNTRSGQHSWMFRTLPGALKKYESAAAHIAILG